jgi:hypothetical protein
MHVPRGDRNENYTYPGGYIPGETVDTRLNENQAEFGVLVLSVAFKVLAD